MLTLSQFKIRYKEVPLNFNAMQQMTITEAEMMDRLEQDADGRVWFTKDYQITSLPPTSTYYCILSIDEVEPNGEELRWAQQHGYDPDYRCKELKDIIKVRKIIKFKE